MFVKLSTIFWIPAVKYSFSWRMTQSYTALLKCFLLDYQRRWKWWTLSTTTLFLTFHACFESPKHYISHPHFQTYSRWLDLLRRNSLRIIVFLFNRDYKSHSRCLNGSLVQKRTRPQKIANVNRRHLFCHDETIRAMDILPTICLANLYGQSFQDLSIEGRRQKRVRSPVRYQSITSLWLRKRVIFIHGENGNYSIPFTNRELPRKNFIRDSENKYLVCAFLFQ